MTAIGSICRPGPDRIPILPRFTPAPFGMSDQLTSRDLSNQLESIRVQLSRIHHDLNNPLSVISGNVELLSELSKALGVETDLGGPIDDLAAAVDILADNVDRLLAVRGLLGKLNEQLEGAS